MLSCPCFAMGFYSSFHFVNSPTVRLFVVMGGCVTLQNRAAVWWALLSLRHCGLFACARFQCAEGEGGRAMRLCVTALPTTDRPGPLQLCRTDKHTLRKAASPPRRRSECSTTLASSDGLSDGQAISSYSMDFGA